jgi:hypothetical protein
VVKRGFGDALEELAADEPHATMALGALLGVGRPRRDARVLRAGPAGRTVCPVIRAEMGVWVAYPVLADAADAPELADGIDRSPAIAVEGATPDVEPLLAHLRRTGAARAMRRITVPWQPVDWDSPGPSTRMATTLDLTALYELYEGFELTFGRTTRGLHRALNDAVRQCGVIVLDGDGRLDGAVIAASRTPTFIEWSHLTVRPEARRHGASWTLMARAIAINLATGLGLVAVIGPGNPMTLPDGLGTVDSVTEIQLRLPQRIRGERRLRRAWLDIDRTRHRRPLRTGDANSDGGEGQW